MEFFQPLFTKFSLNNHPVMNGNETMTLILKELFRVFGNLDELPTGYSKDIYEKLERKIGEVNGRTLWNYVKEVQSGGEFDLKKSSVPSLLCKKILEKEGLGGKLPEHALQSEIIKYFLESRIKVVVETQLSNVSGGNETSKQKNENKNINKKSIIYIITIFNVVLFLFHFIISFKNDSSDFENYKIMNGKWVQTILSDTCRISIAKFDFVDNKLVFLGRSYDCRGGYVGQWNSIMTYFNKNDRVLTYLFTGNSERDSFFVGVDNPALGKIFFRGLKNGEFLEGNGFFKTTDSNQKFTHDMYKINDALLKKMNCKFPESPIEEKEFVQKYYQLIQK